jgi:hypothetical protein
VFDLNLVFLNVHIGRSDDQRVIGSRRKRPFGRFFTFARIGELMITLQTIELFDAAGALSSVMSLSFMWDVMPRRYQTVQRSGTRVPMGSLGAGDALPGAK